MPIQISQQELPSRLLNQITDKNIDWEGHCEFDENGKVVKFKIPNPSNNFRMAPIPMDNKTLHEAKIADLTLKAIMQPATKEQIAICIKRLSLHCGMQAKAPEEVKYLFLDYCNDLAAYPIKLIEDACKGYRTTSEGNQFMPSSGKLISIIEPKYRKFKLLRTRIDKILGTYIASTERQNKTLSLDEALNKLMQG